jgi:hypothetical protein
MPPLRMAGAARSEGQERDELPGRVGLLRPATIAAAKDWCSWISFRDHAASSTPWAWTISLTGITARSASPAATIAVAPVPRGVALHADPVGDAHARKHFLHQEDAAGAARHGDRPRPQQRLPSAPPR